MKTDDQIGLSRPWACGRDGVTLEQEECGDRVIGCVSETVRHRRSTDNGGTGEWDEFEMKHCLDPARPRPRELVEAVLASGQHPRDMGDMVKDWDGLTEV